MASGALQQKIPVVVVGVGAVTAVGVDAAMTAGSVRADLSGFRESALISNAGEPMVLAACDFLETQKMGSARLCELALTALCEALLPIREHSKLPHLSFCLGLPEVRAGFEAHDSQVILNHIEKNADLHFPSDMTAVVPAGHASGLMAVEQAVQWIQAGRTQLAMAGGVDSYLHPDTLEWLDDTQRLHTDENKDGFIPGEGAGFCLLASEQASRRHGLIPLARILSVTSSQEPHPYDSDGICTGQGLTGTLHDTLAVLKEGQKLDWTLCDLNGESFRGTEWMYSYLRTGTRHADPLELWHPADCYGDIGAASGPVLIALGIRAWARDYARGSRCLIWTSSDNCQRASALMERAILPDRN